ncbi:MAG: polymer-forming cytoskeletal protein [Hyphomonadaceae bacterium]
MFTKAKGAENAKNTTTTNNPAQAAIRSASSKPAARAAPSIISSDMHITGSVASDGEMQIDGKIDGDVSATSLTIGTSGEIVGEVKAETVIVRGHVKGSIRARKVELETGAKVQGDIVHASLSIQANAAFEGQVKHTDDPLKQTTPQAANSASSSTTTPNPGQSASSSSGAPISGKPS